MNGINGTVKWPTKLNFQPGFRLLGPSNKLGSFRWYYRFRPCSCRLTCLKFNGYLRLIAVGRLHHPCVSSADFESQKSRLIAKCIREAGQA